MLYPCSREGIIQCLKETRKDEKEPFFFPDSVKFTGVHFTDDGECETTYKFKTKNYCYNMTIASIVVPNRGLSTDVTLQHKAIKRITPAEDDD